MFYFSTVFGPRWNMFSQFLWHTISSRDSGKSKTSLKTHFRTDDFTLNPRTTLSVVFDSNMNPSSSRISNTFIRCLINYSWISEKKNNKNRLNYRQIFWNLTTSIGLKNIQKKRSFQHLLRHQPTQKAISFGFS